MLAPTRADLFFFLASRSQTFHAANQVTQASYAEGEVWHVTMQQCITLQQ